MGSCMRVRVVGQASGQASAHLEEELLHLVRLCTAGSTQAKGIRDATTPVAWSHFGEYATHILRVVNLGLVEMLKRILVHYSSHHVIPPLGFLLLGLLFLCPIRRVRDCSKGRCALLCTSRHARARLSTQEGGGSVAGAASVTMVFRAFPVAVESGGRYFLRSHEIMQFTATCLSTTLC